MPRPSYRSPLKIDPHAVRARGFLPVCSSRAHGPVWEPHEGDWTGRSQASGTGAAEVSTDSTDALPRAESALGARGKAVLVGAPNPHLQGPTVSPQVLGPQGPEVPSDIPHVEYLGVRSRQEGHAREGGVLSSRPRQMVGLVSTDARWGQGRAPPWGQRWPLVNQATAPPEASWGPQQRSP